MNSPSKRTFTLRGREASSRQRYAIACVLENVYGLKVNWEVDPAYGDRMVLLSDNREVASWFNHPLALGASGRDLPLGWSIWEREEGKALRLMLPCFVQAMEDEGDSVSLPFDPLAATFHALTCWDEQHGKLELDAHGRPTTGQLPWRKQSGMARLGSREIPMSNQHHWPWIEVMWHAILDDVKDLPVLRMSFQPTFDVDVAYKHLGRPRWKSLLLQARDLVLGRWSLVVERRLTLRGKKKDAFDTYGWIRECHAEESVGWFVLAADRKPPHDIGLDPNGEALPALVEVLGQGNDVVGWHPSYAAVDNQTVRGLEKARFESWRHGNAHVVRTHYLRGAPGRWWREAVASGVESDASLGWSRDVGFRSGFSRSFVAYDLDAESTLSLVVRPLAVMDTAMRVGLGWSSSDARGHMEAMMELVKEVGGTWMSCWHNTSVSDEGEWQGWRATYVHMVEVARRPQGA